MFLSDGSGQTPKFVERTSAAFVIRYIQFLLLIAAVVGCGQRERMELISSGHSNITFNNRITESDTLNVLTFEYIYNGGGVGVGDFNNDGLSDIFFAGNMVSSRLYLNRGNFVFDDITSAAGITTNAWCTGIATVDIDQDG